MPSFSTTGTKFATLDTIFRSFSINLKKLLLVFSLFSMSYTTNFEQVFFFVEQNVTELEKYQVLKVSIFFERPATDFLPFNMPRKIAGEFLIITIQNFFVL